MNINSPNNSLPHRIKVTFLFSVLVFLSLAFNVSILVFSISQGSVSHVPETIKPSGEFCIEGIFLAPNHIKIISPFKTQVYSKNKINLFDRFDIIARKICFKPLELLAENQEYSLKYTYLRDYSFFLLERNFEIFTSYYPKIDEIKFGDSINYDHVLEYKIDYSTDLLTYYAISGENEVLCDQEHTTILCDIEDLSLNPGQVYQIILVSKSGERIVHELINKTVNILTTVKVNSTSINNNEIIYKPNISEVTIQLNKRISDDISIEFKDENNNSPKFSYEVKDDGITIYLEQPLSQNTAYTITLDDLMGIDGSHNDKQHKIEFAVSDGPKVIESNIGNSFSTDGPITFVFDQNISSNQNFKSLITINAVNNYTYSINKNSLTLLPSFDLNPCRNYQVKINKGIQSSTGLTSTQNYSYTFSTICKRSYSIGYSVGGRPIYGYFYGYGSKKIIFFAAMHGSEYNTSSTLESWMTELDYNISKIPLDKTIIIIPALNPDGISNGSRFNSNGVDINRNFDTNTWVSGTYFQDNFYPEGGGASPFSEPETKTIRNLIIKHSPYLTIAYHSAASYVIPNNSILAVAWAQRYSELSGYKYIQPGADGAFSYDITGTFSEWTEANGYKSLVVELATFYFDEFSRNKKAMWEMVEL